MPRPVPNPTVMVTHTAPPRLADRLRPTTLIGFQSPRWRPLKCADATMPFQKRLFRWGSHLQTCRHAVNRQYLFGPPHDAVSQPSPSFTVTTFGSDTTFCRALSSETSAPLLICSITDHHCGPAVAIKDAARFSQGLQPPSGQPDLSARSCHR